MKFVPSEIPEEGLPTDDGALVEVNEDGSILVTFDEPKDVTSIVVTVLNTTQAGVTIVAVIDDAPDVRPKPFLPLYTSNNGAFRTW